MAQERDWQQILEQWLCGERIRRDRHNAPFRCRQTTHGILRHQPELHHDLIQPHSRCLGSALRAIE
ncbi:hypothetical protein [Prosthecodimorpha hirschii]|uniref:hypothetical protein n=1 Tax=Prosthecodimorpha hirschii TaxID=665126 RepID=UPI00374355F6